MPKISVIMPVYNGAKYLSDAIDSVLGQTLSDFELIIINDGSTDDTESIILSYTDERIKYVKNEENLKIVATLNKGISLSKGEYIARMDADDICRPDRLMKQFQLMESKPYIGVCGSWVKAFGAIDEVWKMPKDHEEVSAALLFFSCLMHPTVFIRKSILASLDVVYDNRYCHAEDYELWTRLSLSTQLYNIQEVLLDYRVIPDRSAYKERQRALASMVRLKYLNELGIEISNEAQGLFELFFSRDLSKNDSLSLMINLLPHLRLCAKLGVDQVEKVVLSQLFVYYYSLPGKFSIFDMTKFILKITNKELAVVYLLKFWKLWLKLR